MAPKKLFGSFEGLPRIKLRFLRVNMDQSTVQRGSREAFLGAKWLQRGFLGLFSIKRRLLRVLKVKREAFLSFEKQNGSK